MSEIFHNTTSADLFNYDEDVREEGKDHQLHSIFVPVVYSAICIFGLIGNLVVIIVFLFYEKMKTLTDIFLVNLATADMLFLCWIFGDIMCKLIRGAYRVNMFTSMLTLTCITFDRFISITQATKISQFQVHKRKWGKVFCAVIWMLSFLLAVPQFKHSINTGSVCYEEYDKQYVEVLVTSFQMAIGFYVPLMVMLTCYTLIIITLINATSFQKHKSLKIIFTLVVAFIATQLPFNVTILIYVLDKNKRVEQDFTTALIITETIAFLHACLNPILYFFVGIKFRKTLWKILKDLGLNKYIKNYTDNMKTTEADSKNISASTNLEGTCMAQV
uniref:C-X-C chemokine receptor type 6 n=1 Tax=Leptobrachium leishanense TaxID=445787 RepID=A0A8C5PZE3_9ANUR